MRILVTGGTGFLGRYLALGPCGSHEIVLGGRNNKQNLFAERFTECRVVPLDVTRIESVRDVVVDVKPDAMIHAAATKFVDRAERQPLECLDVNVVGSENVVRVARERGVRMVLGLPTYKAAPPIRNTYGLSKAIMERLVCSLGDETGTRLACVRYGNVAWSTGSVLPIWKGMHDRNGVIGTTGPEMRRFFFTVDEAVDLVRTAFERFDEVAGGVLGRAMRSARIRDILELSDRAEGRPVGADRGPAGGARRRVPDRGDRAAVHVRVELWWHTSFPNPVQRARRKPRDGDTKLGEYGAADGCRDRRAHRSAAA